ncbi:hypothetical protein D7V86_26795, partial [bacterium D16-51]
YSREGKVRMCKQACIIRARPRGSNTPPLWGELAKGKLGHAPLLCSGVFDSCFHIREDSRNFLYTDRMEFHVIELPKLPKKLKEDDNLLLWAKFINAERKEEFDMLAEKSPYINSAYQHLQVISQDKEKRLEYEAREKAVRDHNQMMKEARERGMLEGRREGMLEGRREGMLEG